MADYVLWNQTDVTTAANEALLKENVQDLLINLFPLDTPLWRLLGHIPMQSVFIANGVDTFSTSYINRAASVFDRTGGSFAGLSAKPEAFTYTSTTPQYAQRLKSVAEIQGKQFGVSRTDRAVSMWGITDRYTLEALKATQSVMNNFEYSFWWSPGTAETGAQLHTGGGTDIARQTQGLCNFLMRSGLQRSKQGGTITEATHLDGNGNNYGTTNPTLNTGAATWVYDANGLPFDQAMFKDNMMAKWYELTGIQSGAMGFMGMRMKNLFSQFALTANGSVNERTLAAEQRSVVDTIDYYTTDAGTVGVNLSRYLNLTQAHVIDLTTIADVTVAADETALFIKPEYFKIGILSPISLSSLGKTRDAEDGLVVGECALVCLNPQAGVGIVNALP